MAMNNGVPGHLIGGTVDQQKLEQITLFPLNPTFSLDRQRAASMNGSAQDLRNIAALAWERLALRSLIS